MTHVMESCEPSTGDRELAQQIVDAVQNLNDLVRQAQERSIDARLEVTERHIRRDMSIGGRRGKAVATPDMVHVTINKTVMLP